jgi:UDP-N-acetylmuramoyl-tripeptide--D-alanyl-D-alanine ligase
VGELAAASARAFGNGASHHESVEDLLVALRPELARNVTVLVKGSRFMRMERVIESIAENQHAA